MNTQLFIPDNIKVGYQQRKDTYTGQLAYIIYQDKAGKWRKEPSWEGWRDKKIEPQFFDNTPTEGFVLNKPVGGHSNGWNHRQSYIRIYDPRNFEFEIQLDNLLFILRETDCSRGKGLHGKFVYAWDGKDLVLLPAECDEYKQSANYTVLQGQKVKVKELIVGATYLTKKNDEVVYLGRFDDYNIWSKPKKNQFVFYPLKKPEYGEQMMIEKSMNTIATLKTADIHPEYADFVDIYNKSTHGSDINVIYLKKCAKADIYYPYIFEKIDDISYKMYQSHRDYSHGANYNQYYYHPDGQYNIISLKDGIIHKEQRNYIELNSSYYSYRNPPTYQKAYLSEDYQFQKLCAKLVNGCEVKVY